jgi:hypothetical protein
MRPHFVLVLVASVLLAMGVHSSLPAQRRDTAVEGVWRFVEEVDKRADGSLIKTSPDGYSGILIFTTSGYMSSTIMPKARTWKRETVTPAELRDTFEGASAHAGRYELDTAKHAIRMENSVSVDPADEGKWDVVKYRVSGETLELSGPWTYKGEKITFTIRLRRMPER